MEHYVYEFALCYFIAYSINLVGLPILRHAKRIGMIEVEEGEDFKNEFFGVVYLSLYIWSFLVTLHF